MKLTEKKVFRPLASNLLRENPAFSTAAGLCVLLFATGSLDTALRVGIADTILLVLLTFLPFCFARLPEKIVPLLTIAVGSAAVTLLAVLLHAGEALVISFLPCLLLGKNLGRRDHPLLSLWHGFTKGIGLLLGLLLTAFLRELLGSGTCLGAPLLPFAPFPLMAKPLGTFFLVGFLCALKNLIAPSSHRETEEDTVPAALSDDELEFASEISDGEKEPELLTYEDPVGEDAAEEGQIPDLPTEENPTDEPAAPEEIFRDDSLPDDTASDSFLPEELSFGSGNGEPEIVSEASDASEDAELTTPDEAAEEPAPDEEEWIPVVPEEDTVPEDGFTGTDLTGSSDSEPEARQEETQDLIEPDPVTEAAPEDDAAAEEPTAARRVSSHAERIPAPQAPAPEKKTKKKITLFFKDESEAKPREHVSPKEISRDLFLAFQNDKQNKEDKNK